MLKTGTRQIARQERNILEAAVGDGAPTVTGFGTVKWVLVWTGGLCLLGLPTYGLVSLSPGPIVGTLLAAPLVMAAILCLYAIIALISGHFHLSRVGRDFQRNDVPEIRKALADGTVRAISVEAAAVVTIEECEDEGAGFVFDVGDGKLLFVKGQQYWPAEEGMAWPNSSFEIVRTVVGNRWVGIFCHGAPLEPVEVLQTAECREDLVWAECEETVEASLGDFTRSIRRTAQVDSEDQRRPGQPRR